PAAALPRPRRDQRARDRAARARLGRAERALGRAGGRARAEHPRRRCAGGRPGATRAGGGGAAPHRAPALPRPRPVSRRRLYLLRHAEVAYFDGDGHPVRPADVSLTPAGREQARAAAALFQGVRLDRVVTSGLARTLETARLVAPESEPESWPDL